MSWRRSPPGIANKYRAIATVVDGVRFDSKAEARRWVELQQLQAAGQIRKLRRQVRYELPVNDQVVAKYVADFVYQRAMGDYWQEVVEDVKGIETPMFRLKAKLMRAIHGINIAVTGGSSR